MSTKRRPAAMSIADRLRRLRVNCYLAFCSEVPLGDVGARLWYETRKAAYYDGYRDGYSAGMAYADRNPTPADPVLLATTTKPAEVADSIQRMDDAATAAQEDMTP